MSGDYEVNKLVRMRERYRARGKDSYAYTYTRLFLAYASRLIFALGWNQLRDSSDRDSDALLYDRLFQRSTKRRKDDSIEPGEYADILRSISKKQVKAKPALKEELGDFIALLEKMGKFRDEYAHIVATVGLNTYLQDSKRLIDRFNILFANKVCEYLIPVSGPTAGRELECYCVRPDEDDAANITISVPAGWKNPEQKLFYRIRDMKSGNVTINCLSPFISFGTLSLIEDAEIPHFWIYQYVATSSYSDSTYPLRYTRIYPSEIWDAEDPNQTAPVAKCMSKNWNFQLSDLFRDDFSQDISGGKMLWYQSRYNSTFINISSYPGYGTVVKHKYQYCEEICPQRAAVMRFCQDTKRQCMYIFGNGGIGKTALVLSVLNELFNTSQTLSPRGEPVYHFTHLIFLSAKRGYYHIANLGMDDGQADIYDYDEFLNKLSALLEIFPEKGEAVTKDMILNHIAENGSANRYLLIIDDLDSLQKDVQEKIEDFISGTEPKLMKTIITTRFIYPKSNNHIMLSKLEPEASIKFAKWYYTTYYQKHYNADWDSWPLREKATRLLESYGDGNPLRIMRCIELVRQGLEPMLNVPASRREGEAYFYNTVQNILNEPQKQLFEICRQLYLNFPEDCRSGDMPAMNIAIPKYLCVGLNIDADVFEEAFQGLRIMLLLKSPNARQFKPYEDFLIEDGVVSINSVQLPPMYRYVLEEIAQHPDKWNYSVEQTLYECLTQLQQRSEDPSESVYFATEIAMRIFECMVESGDASRTVSDNIRGWIKQNAITETPSNTNERLIQSIENDWAELKKKFERGESDETLQSQFQKGLSEFRRKVEKMPEELVARYKRVLADYNEY